MKDIHVESVSHMGCPYPRQSNARDLPAKSTTHKTDLSHPFLAHSCEYRRPCLSLLCLLHQQHQTTRCSSYDRQPYLFCPINVRLPPRAICPRAVGLDANSSLVGTREWEGVWGWFLCGWNLCTVRLSDLDNVPHCHWSSPIKLSVHASHLSHQLTVSNLIQNLIEYTKLKYIHHNP